MDAIKTIQELINACDYILNITGGSSIWDGETHIALKKIEEAVFNAKGMMNIINQESLEYRAKYREHHGKSRTQEYYVWAGMIQRCTNPNNPMYKNYGGRGITVCGRWRNSFKAFYEDMGPRPGPKYSTERINNNRGYYKENCNWATCEKQNQNRRNMANNTSGISGVCWNKRHRSWEVRISKNNKRIHLGYFKTKKEAIKVRKKAEQKHWPNHRREQNETNSSLPHGP